MQNESNCDSNNRANDVMLRRSLRTKRVPVKYDDYVIG